MKFTKICIFMFFFLGVNTAFFRIKKSSGENVKSRLRVVCTVSMLTDTVRHIAGDYVEVIGLMGPGVDPHLYKARESDAEKLYNADLILFNGLHLEGKMGHLFSSMKKKAVAIAESIPKNKLIEVEFQTYDPHVWHDVELWIMVVQEITKQLIDLDKNHAQEYKVNAKKYIKKLHELSDYIKQAVTCLSEEQRILVTAHDAFNYFGKAYGFTVVGLQGISTDAEISTKDVQNLADFIVRKKVPAIFLESSIPQRNIEAVQKAVEARGSKVLIGPELLSDSVGDYQTNTHTYYGMIKYNIDSIIAALQKKVTHE